MRVRLCGPHTRRGGARGASARMRVGKWWRGRVVRLSGAGGEVHVWGGGTWGPSLQGRTRCDHYVCITIMMCNDCWVLWPGSHLFLSYGPARGGLVCNGVSPAPTVCTVHTVHTMGLKCRA